MQSPIEREKGKNLTSALPDLGKLSTQSVDQGPTASNNGLSPLTQGCASQMGGSCFLILGHIAIRRLGQ